MNRCMSNVIIAMVVLMPAVNHVACAAVGDSIYVTNSGDVSVKLLNVNTTYADTLTVYSKTGVDLTHAAQDRWMSTPLFTSSSPIGSVVQLTPQQAGFPLLFFLRNETIAAGNYSGQYKFSTGNNFPMPYSFDLSTTYSQFADVQWLPDNKAIIGFPDYLPAGTTSQNYSPGGNGDFAMLFEVSNVTSVPEPSTGMLWLLGLAPGLLLVCRRSNHRT